MSALIHDVRPLFLHIILTLLAGMQPLLSQNFRLLHYVQTTGWDHGTADESLQMFQQLGAIHNFAVDHDADGSSFNDLATLQQYDVIVWSNTSGSYNLNAQQRANFEAYILGGGSYLGIHAASDTYRHSSANGGDTGFWDFYAETVCGGSVQTNPNHTAQNYNADLTHINPHPSLDNLPNPWNKNEEYYYWENGYLSPGIVEVLRVGSTGNQSYDAPRPISWYMNLPGGGRSFYTALGHDPANFTTDTFFRNHIRDALLWVVNASAGTGETVSGELKKWHTLTLTFDGPGSSEDDLYNPFLNYRLDVTFSNGSKQYVVPGYFAADGNAAETSAGSGNKWRVHFTPDEEGTWTYTVSFRTGTNVAIDDNPLAGTPMAPDGLSGSFTIGPNDKTGNDLRAKGRLEYARQRYLRFAETGEYFFKGGSNSPENFLGYAEFDNTYDNGGNGNALETTDPYVSQGQPYAYQGDGLHHYLPHVGDWQPGDPQWQGTKGKGIIGAINYLASEGVNALYFLTMNVDGDGREVFPWTEYWMRDRFDVSKLAQWEIVFEHLQQKGIVLHLVLQEQENDQLLDGGYLGTYRKLYLRELIARFAHHPGLMWNLGEENTNTHQQRLDMAQYIRQLDPYQHVINVHTFIGQQQDIYGQLLGNSLMEVASLQMDLPDIHAETQKWVLQSAQSGHPWAVFSDEIGPFQTGVAPDGPGNNHHAIRHQALYANLFAGGGGTEWYFGYDEAHNDLDCEDFRSRDQMWDYTRIARQFMLDHSTFLAMRPADELVDNPQAYCFAWDSVSYLIYLPFGGTTQLDLGAFGGSLPVKWFNPRTGGPLQTGSVSSLSGPGWAGIGLPPGGSTEDWIAIVGSEIPQAPNTPPVFSLSGDVNVMQNFTSTESVLVSPLPPPPGEAGQSVIYSLSPPAVSFANVSINPLTGEVSITAVPDSFGTQVFYVYADDGQPYNNIAVDSFLLTVQSEVAASSLVNINCGGNAYTASSGELYEADTYFTGGNVFTTTNPIANTPDDSLYQSERTAAGGFSYAIPVSNGNYKIRLHFAEIFHTAPAARIMDVSLEGQPVLTNFDIFAEAGAFTAFTKDFPVTIADGFINLDFSATVDQPKISAIQVLTDSGPPPPNTPPTFSLSSSSLSLDEDFSTTETITLTPDPVPPGEQSQQVTYSLSPASVSFANVSIDPLSGTLTITAVPDEFGSQTFTVTADDGQLQNNVATQSFTLTVNAVNDAPVFTTSGDLLLDEDFGGTQTVNVIPGFVPANESGQVVTYSLTPASVSFANVSLDPLTGTVSVTAIADSSGEQIFTLTADDGQAQNFTHSETFVLRINAVNDPPDFSVSGDVVVDENFSTTEMVTVTPDPVPLDEAGQLVLYSLAPGTVPFANVSIDPLSGTVLITSVPNANGSQVFTITANDGQLQNNFATRTFTLTVNAVNQPPTFSMSGDLLLNEDFAGTQQVTAILDPVPPDEAGQTVTYSLSPATVGFANVSIDAFTGVVSVTAAPDASGVQNFTVTANDGQSANNTASDNFQLLVNPVNDPPAFTLSGDINVDQDFTTTEVVSVTPAPVPADESAQVVTYTLSPATVSFANVSIDPNTGMVSITSVPGQSGSQTFTLTADDGQAQNNTYSQTFTLTVNLTNNTPPTFTTSGDIILDEDFAGTASLTVTPDPVPPAENGQMVTYSLSPASVSFANVSIDPNTGTVSVTAVPDSNGSQVFTLTANDGQRNNNLATQTFTLQVNPVNDPPVFTHTGDIIAQEDFVGTRTLSVIPLPPPADEAGQSITYSLLPATVPFANVSIDPATGTVNITAIPDQVGSQFFTIRADDGQATNNLANLGFLLIVNQVNDPPVFTLSGDLNLNENFPGVEMVTVTAGPPKPGEELQQVLYSLDPPAVPFANVSIDPNTGNVSVTAVPNFYGSQTFTVYANDGSFPNNVYSQTFTLTVNQTDNTPPTFSLSGDVVVDEDFVTTETVTVTPDPVPPDEAGQTVTYSLSPASVPFANITFDTLSGLVSITAVPDANGSQVFTITADDGAATNNTATASFTLTVNAVNEPPVFTHTGDVTVDEDFNGTRTVSVTPGPVPPDEVGQTVTYSLSPATVPFANVSIDPATGTVSISAVPDGNGSQSFTLLADDGQSANNTYFSVFTLTVNPRNDAPDFVMSGDIVVDEDFTTIETVSAIPTHLPGDESGQTVTYSLSPASVPFANVSLDPATGIVSVTAVPNASGTQSFTVDADDGQPADNLAFATFTLVVNPINDAPTFSTSGDVLVPEDFPGTEMVVVTPDPVPADESGQVVTYSLSPPAVSFANIAFDPATGNVSITSVPDASGTQFFTITANDGQAQHATASAGFTLTVSPQNDAPTFSVSGDVVVDEDFSTTEIVTVIPHPVQADEVGQTVTYSLSPASVPFANVSIDPATGTVSITAVPDGNGSQMFTITADDGQAINNLATATFNLTVNPVNDDPAFVVSGDLLLQEDFPGTETVSVTPGPVPANESGQVVTYSLQPATVSFAQVQIDPATGTVSVTAVPDASGSQVFTIIANDGQAQNNTYQASFTLTVQAINDAPTFSLSGDVVVDENFTTTELVTLTPDPVPADESGQIVLYTLTPATVSFANIAFDPLTGTVSITSVPDASGSQTFTITADDGQAENFTASATFTLTVRAVNNPPTFDLSSTDLTLLEDFTGTEHIFVTPDPVPADEAAQIVTYSLLPASVPFANVSIDPTTGTVSITALPDSWGSQTFTITADDGQSEFNQATRTFSLNIQAVNDPPVFVLSGDLMLEENFVGTATVSATPGPVPADESSQGVTYSLDPPTVSFANVSIDPATGEVSVTALPDASGTQTFTVTANDGQSENNTFSQTFTLSIRAVNNPPTFSLSGDVIVEENFPTTERVQVTPDPVPADEQDQVVIYRLSPSSVPFANVHIDSLSGTILITAVQDSFGAQTFTVTADDGQAENNIATATFTLIVRSVNNAPTFSTSGDLLLEEDFSGTATVNVIPDPVPDNERDQQLRYSLNPASVGFAALTFNTFTGMVEVRALPDANGSQEFVITADDGQAENNLATDTFLLVVQPVNDVPAFVLDVNTLELEEDFEGTATVNALPEPVPADEQNQQVVYRLVPDSVPFARFDFDSTNGQLRISALPNAHGEASMMMIADDGQDSLNLDTARFVLRILSTNDPPTFSLSGDLTLPWNFPGTEEVILTPDPVPADEQDQQVSYSLEPANISFARLSFDSQTGRVSFMAEPDSFGSQVFTITANDGQDMNHTASASFTFTVLPPEPTSLRINCGADRDMAFGQYLFIADTFHFGGDVFYNPHIKDVLQTTWDELYRSERNAPSGVNTFEYDIPLRNGKYIVYLHFAETYWGAFGGGCCGNLGQRVFNVEVEGTPELVGFDILEHVGPMTALVQQVPVSIADGSLHLKFKALQDRPAIKAIEILTPADSATSISMIQNPNNPFVDPIYEFGTEPTPGDGNMLIYPNPVPDDMTILLENRMEGLLEVFVYDSFGKRYKEFTIDKKERYATFTLPVDDLIPGYYAIQVVDPNTGFSIARKFWKITR